jgi:restriction endonuclease S subunit
VGKDYLNVLNFPLPALAEHKRRVEKIEEIFKVCDILKK